MKEIRKRSSKIRARRRKVWWRENRKDLFASMLLGAWLGTMFALQI